MINEYVGGWGKVISRYVLEFIVVWTDSGPQLKAGKPSVHVAKKTKKEVGWHSLDDEG